MSELHTIVCDGYDRDVFAELLSVEPQLQRTQERVQNLLPHPEPLLCDLFSSLFKMNVELRKPEALSAGVQINQRLLSAVLRSDAIWQLRKRTQLNRKETAVALVVLAEQVLKALARDDRVRPAELLEAMEAAHDEDALDQRKKELDHLSSMGEEAFDEAERDQLKESLQGEIEKLQKRVRRAREKQERLARSLSVDIELELDQALTELPEQLDQIDAQMSSFGLGGGDPKGQSNASARMELGERLLKSKKLKLLAKLVGAFKEVAFEARRRRIYRAPQELHEVNMGAALERILPSELLGLGRSQDESKLGRALALDFKRKLLERQLLVYDIEAPAERGPMVVCVDGSSSMQGSKELWAKAVSLTLMEIARREKRRCLAIVFSSGRQLFEAELVGGKVQKGRNAINDEEVLRFAEHFPGGGTSFEEPLDRAVEAVSKGRFRRGDIVFITDGEAHISEELVTRLQKKKRKHAFKIRGVVVDVAHSRTNTMERFCDDIRRVTDLTADSMSDLFANV